MLLTVRNLALDVGVDELAHGRLALDLEMNFLVVLQQQQSTKRAGPGREGKLAKAVETRQKSAKKSRTWDTTLRFTYSLASGFAILGCNTHIHTYR